MKDNFSWDHTNQKVKFSKTYSKTSNQNDIEFRNKIKQIYREQEAKKLGFKYQNGEADVELLLKYFNYLKRVKGIKLYNTSKPIADPKNIKSFLNQLKKAVPKKPVGRPRIHNNRVVKQPTGRKRGRPKGSVNKPKVLSEEEINDILLEVPEYIEDEETEQDLDTPTNTPKKRGPVPKRIEYINSQLERIDPSHTTTKKKSDGKEEKAVMTFRKWIGEHYNFKTKNWELPEGYWWNPLTEKWELGNPKLDYFYWYYEFIYDGTKYDYPIPLGKCHITWGFEIENGPQLQGFLCPRDHYKTEYLNVGFMCFYALEKPELAKTGLLNIAWDKGLAESTYEKVQKNFSENEKILSFYGYILDDDRRSTQTLLYFKYQSVGSSFGMKCTSWSGGAITGSHPCLVLLDDIEDEPLSDKDMEKFKRVIKNKLLPAVGRYGRIIVTGTIKGYNDTNDVYLYLETNDLWEINKYPAADKMPPMSDITKEDRIVDVINPKTGEIIRNAQGKPKRMKDIFITVKNSSAYKTLYPERYSIEALVKKRFQMASKGESDDAFWSEYFLKAVNPAGKMLKRERMVTDPPPGYTSWDEFRRHLVNDPEKDTSAWFDPGGISKRGHGIALAICYQEEGMFHVCEMVVYRISIPEIAEDFATLMDKWSIGTWGVEGNYNQSYAIGDTLERELYEVLKKRGMEHLFSKNSGVNNTKNKVERIKGKFEHLLGIEGTEKRFFVNPRSRDFDQFIQEFTSFGPGMTLDEQKALDLLDCIASIAIHFIGVESSMDLIDDIFMINKKHFGYI